MNESKISHTEALRHKVQIRKPLFNPYFTSFLYAVKARMKMKSYHNPAPS